MPGTPTLRLKLRDPGGNERELSFDRDVVRIGRARDCDLSLDSGFISRYHARIERQGNGWQVIDEGSKNGVFVNGQRVSSSGSQALQPGDALRIGDYGLSVELEEEEDLDRTVIIPPSARGAAPARPPAPAEPEPEPTMETAAPAAVPPAATEGAAAAVEAPAPSATEAPTPTAPEAAPPAPAVPAEEQPAPATAAGRLRLDPARRTATLDDRPPGQELSAREFALLAALVAAGGEGRRGEDLIEAVWGRGGADEEMLDRLVYRLQRKLEPDAAGPGLVEAQPGGRYRLTV